jgi:hypothetical protein
MLDAGHAYGNISINTKIMKIKPKRVGSYRVKKNKNSERQRPDTNK